MRGGGAIRSGRSTALRALAGRRYTTPKASIASATFLKPAILAPFT